VPESDAGSGELPSSVDARQLSLLGAGWTLGSLKYITQSAVRSATWFETVGWKGLMETESGSPNRELFPSLPGSVFPLYHVFADFGEFRGGEIVPLQSTDPLRVDGCLLQLDGKQAILVANLTPDEQSIEIPLPDNMANPELRILDETNAELASTNPDAFRAAAMTALEPDGGRVSVILKPFACARISGQSQN
jgi:D-apionolactonase